LKRPDRRRRRPNRPIETGHPGLEQIHPRVYEPVRSRCQIKARAGVAGQRPTRPQPRPRQARRSSSTHRTRREPVARIKSRRKPRSWAASSQPTQAVARAGTQIMLTTTNMIASRGRELGWRPGYSIPDWLDCIKSRPRGCPWIGGNSSGRMDRGSGRSDRPCLQHAATDDNGVKKHAIDCTGTKTGLTCASLRQTLTTPDAIFRSERAFRRDTHSRGRREMKNSGLLHPVSHQGRVGPSYPSLQHRLSRATTQQIEIKSLLQTLDQALPVSPYETMFEQYLAKSPATSATSICDSSSDLRYFVVDFDGYTRIGDHPQACLVLPTKSDWVTSSSRLSCPGGRLAFAVLHTFFSVPSRRNGADQCVDD